MRRVTRLQARNKFDLTDRAQVRQMSRRLNVPEQELRRIAGRIGTSIAAISKEIALQRTPVPAETPPPAVIDAVVPESESASAAIAG
jgi:phage host-nuclease inhibitor protein Gam